MEESIPFKVRIKRAANAVYYEALVITGDRIFKSRSLTKEEEESDLLRGIFAHAGKTSGSYARSERMRNAFNEYSLKRKDIETVLSIVKNNLEKIYPNDKEAIQKVLNSSSVFLNQRVPKF